MRALVLSLFLVAGPALAQEAPVATAPPPPPAATQAAAPDPLGDLITQTGTTEEEDEAAPTAPVPRHKPTLLPIPEPEPPEASFPPDGDHAVPLGTYIPSERAYELRVKGSIVAAQGLQGPLDGGWKVTAPDGAVLYALQIVDPAGGSGPLEGAWRDVRRPGAVGSTGLIETVERAGQTIVFHFNPRPDQTSVLTLTPAAGPRWSGSLYEGGVNQAVTAEREAPPSLPPGYVIQGRGPVIWGAPRAAATSRSVSAPATCSTKGKKGKALKAAKAKCAAVARKGGKAATLKSKKGSKAKATPAHKGKATASKKKSSAKKKPNLR
ncbi:MAG: hypothetical protein KKC14_04730 [Alphaproteobacteria bacterium]|nr:hypothetical protein [Alphaproteobacteria bacterium]